MSFEGKKREGHSVEHRTETKGRLHDAKFAQPPDQKTNTCQFTQTERTNTPINIPNHTYHSSHTNAAVQTTEVPSMEPTEQEMQSWIEQLTSDSVQRALSAAETVGYDQMEIQQIAQNLAYEQESIPIVHVPNDNRPYIRVDVNNNKRYPLLDSGAMVCVISYVQEEELNSYNQRILPCSMTVSTVTQADHQVTGVMWLQYEIGERTACIPTVVMKSHRSYFIVGMNFFKAFDIQFIWGDACTCAPKVMPWGKDRPAPYKQFMPPATEKHNDEPIGGEKSNDSPTPCKITTTQTGPTTSMNIGMISLAHRLSNCQLNRLRTRLGRSGSINDTPGGEPTLAQTEHASNFMGNKFEQARKCVENINNSLFHRNTYTRYETDVEMDECAWLSDPDSLTNQAPADVSVAELALTLLKGMPTPNFYVAEIAMQNDIITATDEHDTLIDIQPQKHCCVSEPHTLTSEQQQQLDEVMKEFPYTSESGPLNCTHVYTQKINTGNALPEMRKQYQMSPYVLAEVEKEIEKLIERSIIEPIDFSAWRWPILWVKKKNGGGRICVDARGLNKITIRDAYPTLKVDAILQNLPNAKFISCLDMTQAFHQIPIAPEDRDKTAFAVGHRFYRYTRALMGFTNSPADLAKVLDKVFGDMMPKVYHYVDDFVILSATFEEHIALLREVAKRLREANLTISQEKSSFCYKRVTFLGYVLAEEGLSANPERIKPIVEYKRPETVKEMRRLIGMIGWYRRFLPNIAATLAPLTDLMKGDSKLKIRWNERAEGAFEAVKMALMSPAILAPADYTLPYKIYTDASLTAGAAVLTQMQKGQEKVIAFHSAKFSVTQSNYSATERECLAVLMGVEKFRPYIDGVQFTVVTDHASLKWLQNLKEPHGKLARWAVRLQAFDIVFEHRPGTQMVVPDALSRSVELVDLNASTNDRWYLKMYELAKDQKVKRYKISNGLLYHMGRYDIRTGDNRWSLCVPNEKVSEVLAEQHDNASHPGYWKTLKSAQRMYYWPKMYEQMSDHIRACKVCKQIKHTNENTRVPIENYRDPISVGRVLSLDLIGPLPSSSIRRYQWVIVAVDVFSKYVFAKACTHATTNIITDFLEKEIFYRFDTPEILITDNGTQFTAEKFKQFTEEHGIAHVFTPVYHPQANPVESSNKTIKQLLRAELIEKLSHAEWSSYLNKVIMRINTTPRLPTGFSPHFLAFGREKVQQGTEHRIINDENSENVRENEHDQREVIYEQAAEEQRHAFEINKNRYNLRASKRSFNPGDNVWINVQKQSCAAEKYSQKLGPKRKCAYVKQRVDGSSDMYELVDGNNKPIGTYHATQMQTR